MLHRREDANNYITSVPICETPSTIAILLESTGSQSLREQNGNERNLHVYQRKNEFYKTAIIKGV